MFAFIETTIGCIRAFAPEEGLGGNLFFAFFAGGQVQGLQMLFESLLPFFDGAQVGERGDEFRFRRRVCEGLQQKTSHLVVRRDQHAVSAARSFEHKFRGESERVEQPVPG